MGNLTDRIKEMINAELNGKMSGHVRGEKDALVLAICSQKGGVGKTTTTVNLSAALSQFHGKRVLVLDLDPQGHVEKSLGSQVVEGIDYSPMSQLFMAKKADLMDGVVKTSCDSLHITPGDKALYEAEGALSSKIGREFILKEMLATARTLYDIIVMDCPPNLGNLTINALCAADYVLVPCEMSVLAFEGVSDLLETLETIRDRLNPELKVLGVLFTRVDGRNVVMNQLVDESMRKHFKGGIFKTQIAVNTDLNKAQLEGVSIFDYAPRSSGAEHYQNLADEIIQLIGREGRRVSRGSSHSARGSTN